MDWVDYGKVRAGELKGDEKHFDLELITVWTKSISEAQRILLPNEEIHALKKQIMDKEAEIKKDLSGVEEYDGSIIPEKLQEIEQLEKNLPDHSTFKLSNFLIYIGFFIPLSIYLLLFYTSVARSAFYGIDPTSLIEGKTISVGILPNFSDLIHALSTNYMLVFTPFVFFAFGVVVHIFLEIEGKIKYILLALIILVTLILDSFMAFKIHEETTKALSLIYDESEASQFTREWFKDVNFYIVLFMGFVVFIMWSIIFHAIRSEWSRRDIRSLHEKHISHLKEKLNHIHSEKGKLKSHIEENKKYINDMERLMEVPKINLSDVETNIRMFQKGWNQYYNFRELDGAEEKMKTISIKTDTFLKSPPNVIGTTYN